LEDDLARTWGDRAIALVAEPELEAWLVGARASLVGIDLMRGAPDPAAWWLDTGRAIKGEKPSRPKEAIDAWLALRGVTRTSSVVRDVASRASLSVERCRSRTFHKLRRALAGWFPRS
ncbi:MAG TPA: hypothetical protein PKA64_20915, partial [Myxococcota bacterium]|nr:hypothetical protein [Myxococcota bacterium]